MKDSTLEEINKAFQEQAKHNQLNVATMRNVSLLLDQHNAPESLEAEAGRLMEQLREAIGQIDFEHLEFYEGKMLDITARHNEQMKVLSQL